MAQALAARRPSKVWMTGILVSVLLGLTTATAAVLVQRQASRPVGEGELFRSEADQAAARYTELVSSGSSPFYSVRAVRNDLAVEAVGVVIAEGIFTTSSSVEQRGSPLPGFLRWALENGRLAALASPLSHPISVDGVIEHRLGDVVYQVLKPLGDGSGLVLSYDISELLQRRSNDRAIQPSTIQLAVAAVIFMGLAGSLGVARSRTQRQIANAQQESEMHESRSRELEQHNRRLQEARRKAERALALAEETNRVRSEFVLMINHELRTPLTSVVTGAELLMDQPDLSEDERSQLLETIVQEGRRLVELMSQMLTVARAENRGLQFELSPVSSRVVIDALVGRSEQITVTPPQQDLVVNSDTETLRVLLGSLADNARTHGAGHVNISVADALLFEPDRIEGPAPENPIYFLVKDDGPGIDPSFLPRAFEKFEKQGRASGTGLGLYLARMMTEALEGHLAVKTSPGGTTFAVGLPAARVREEVMASS